MGNGQSQRTGNQEQSGQQGNAPQGSQTGSAQDVQPRGNQAVQDQLDLNTAKDEARSAVGAWYTETVDYVDRDQTAMAGAMEDFIEFEGSGEEELGTIASVAGGALALPVFGTVGAVVGFCVATLGTLATLGGDTAKKARAVRDAENKGDEARDEARDRKNDLIGTINSASTEEDLEPVRSEIRRLPAVVEVRQNIIYRDLLLAFAEEGGYNLTGSQWNVNNMSVFGDAPWYHSWDWGSPGWVNGRDIAEELNELAEGDPSTRTNVDIND